MGIIDSLAQRRTYYHINKKLPVSEDAVVKTVEKVVELVPDAFNMHSQRVVIALGDKQNQLWDAAYDAFKGEVVREKLDSFKAGAGTILYFIDQKTVASLQKQYPLYVDNFPIWAQQSNGMLQISVWSALRELDVAASLQHYDPVIDDAVYKLFNVPRDYKLVGEMPFGGIGAKPDPKEPEDVTLRVSVAR
ncbi:MAG: nitroreductase family protein [Atopobiaceae bacterium]|jgi:predicted oxidoreductase (fatty acid repression mutant protein)|nr:nitroreductase family protein [Atopobium sp.]